MKSSLEACIKAKKLSSGEEYNVFHFYGGDILLYRNYKCTNVDVVFQYEVKNTKCRKVLYTENLLDITVQVYRETRLNCLEAFKEVFDNPDWYRISYPKKLKLDSVVWFKKDKTVNDYIFKKEKITENLWYMIDDLIVFGMYKCFLNILKELKGE